MALMSVMAMCDSEKDTEARYFGKSVNEPLNADFWVSEPRAGWICNVYVMQIKDGRVVKDMFVATEETQEAQISVEAVEEVEAVIYSGEI